MNESVFLLTLWSYKRFSFGQNCMFFKTHCPSCKISNGSILTVDEHQKSRESWYLCYGHPCHPQVVRLLRERVETALRYFVLFRSSWRRMRAPVREQRPAQAKRRCSEIHDLRSFLYTTLVQLNYFVHSSQTTESQKRINTFKRR